MKTAIIAIVSLLAGLGAGLFYGWSTGVVDGQTYAMTSIIPIVQRYGAYRGTDEIEKRDEVMDAVTIASVATFVKGRSYSPMFMYFHPRADMGLVKALIVWELDHPDSHDFPAKDEASKARILKVKQEMKEYWDMEIQRQRSRRLEIQQRDASDSEALEQADSVFHEGDLKNRYVHARVQGWP